MTRLCFFSHLDTENSKDDEKSTADEDDVADGLEWRDERLHHQLQTRSSADHPAEEHRCRLKKSKEKEGEETSSVSWLAPEGTQRSEQSENSEHTQDLGPARHGHHNVN